MQDFTDLYIEHGNIAAGVDGIEWVDLWRNQVGFLEDEMPFPSPAVFLSYYILEARDIGENVQEIKWQVDVRLFFETMADTSRGSVNQTTAVAFLRLLNALYAKFHGSGGENYSSMRRVGMGMEDSGNAGNLYKMSFTCISLDYAAQKEYADSTVAELDIENSAGSPDVDVEPLFEI